MISAVLEGKLEKVEYQEDKIFGVQIPMSCPGVPEEILYPKGTWEDQTAFEKTVKKVAQQFVKNFEKYADYATDEISSGAPRV